MRWPIRRASSDLLPYRPNILLGDVEIFDLISVDFHKPMSVGRREVFGCFEKIYHSRVVHSVDLKFQDDSSAAYGCGSSVPYVHNIYCSYTATYLGKWILLVRRCRGRCNRGEPITPTEVSPADDRVTQQRHRPLQCAASLGYSSPTQPEVTAIEFGVQIPLQSVAAIELAELS